MMPEVPDVKRKTILAWLRHGPTTASGLQGPLGCGRDEVVRRLRVLVDEGLVEVETVDGVRRYRLSRLAAERMR